ncbi:MAG: IS200/IS605 family transposase [Pyrinomonadaceae bacterium MAG19_C2-C3]|nr:IS200/IS605 family transposase [Pyrinomonadaceae bacterium MAG19_C2-C3]
MVFRTSAHAAYDTAYHLVWSPKYRKKILTGAIAQRVEEMFREIAESYDITIDEMEVSIDHVHIFCSFPPRYSIAQIVTRFKSLSARAVFREFPQVKKQLWHGEFWEGGYFARTVGDKVTAEVIRQYIRRHRELDSKDEQPRLFD